MCRMALVTPGGDRTSISATHMGRTSGAKRVHFIEVRWERMSRPRSKIAMAREPIETCDGPCRVLTRGREKPRRPCRSLRGVRLHPPTELAAGDEYDVTRAEMGTTVTHECRDHVRTALALVEMQPPAVGGCCHGSVLRRASGEPTTAFPRAGGGDPRGRGARGLPDGLRVRAGMPAGYA